MRPNISRAELFAFVRSLGADPMQVQGVEVDPHEVRVTAYRLDERGYRFTEDGKTGATETTAIPIVGSGDQDTVRMRHPALDREVEVPASAAGQHAVAGWEVVAPPKAEPEEQPESAPDGKNETPRRRRTTKEG